MFHDVARLSFVIDAAADHLVPRLCRSGECRVAEWVDRQTAWSPWARQSARAARGGHAGGEMRGGVDNARAGRPRPALRSSRRGARYVGVTLIGALAAAGLAACGTSSAGTGPVTLNFYNFPDPSGAVQSAVDNCSKASHGKYTIVYNKLQSAADQQRLQMARRLAAGD